MAGPTHGLTLGLTLGAGSVDYLAAGGALAAVETPSDATFFWPAPVEDAPTHLSLSFPQTRIPDADAATLTLDL